MIAQVIRELLRKTPAYNTLHKIRSRIDYFRWDKCSFPPPHYAKQRIVLEYAREYQCETLIETGTYLGFMVEAMSNHFEKIVSIELDATLSSNAIRRFSKYRHVSIHCGDSARLLPQLLISMDVSSCLFWLDGHYSGGATARGEIETPIVAELRAIFQYVRKPVILIDDARCFTGDHDYPLLETVQEIAEREGFSFVNQDDVIRLTAMEIRPDVFSRETSSRVEQNASRRTLDTAAVDSRPRCY
jgi:hypothetical protein